MGLKSTSRVRAAFWGASALALLASAPALAQDEGASPGPSEHQGGVVPGGTLDPNAPPPEGIFDFDIDDDGRIIGDVTGVGQMITRPNQAGFGFGSCTGTLINPRTVIFAAHCVNANPTRLNPDGTITPGVIIPASAYGFASGGIAMGFSFRADTFDGVLAYFGLTQGGTLRNRTNLAEQFYNVEQVWYDPRSVALGPDASFLEADIALATLDTPAFDVPTWAMLFSELGGQTRVTVNGYGRTGNGGIGSVQDGNFFRRAAENMLSVLGSLRNVNQALGFANPGALAQNLYMLDFDSPGGEASFAPSTNTTNGRFDFDIFNGAALPREGTTGPGDSGGPLIIDQRFDGRGVTIGTLSGGSRNAINIRNPDGTVVTVAPPFGAFGTRSFYQPLFMFWDTIVAQNSYAYATNNVGVRNWEDAAHWVQTLDPNYVVEVDGELVNALPGNPGVGVSADTGRFGEVCFLANCVDIQPGSTPTQLGTLNGFQVAGGPGTTGFVPNNVVGTRNGPRARYYDVTLSAPGATTVNSAITIDRLALDGLHLLNVRSGASLRSIGDFDHLFGGVIVDGTLRTNNYLLLTGALSGSGTVDPTTLTVVAGGIAPGTVGGIGTLTIAGNLVLSSGAGLAIDFNRTGNDVLAVVGDGAQAGAANLGGAAVFTLSTRRTLPRSGQSFTFLTAAGGITNSFDAAFGGIGILRPQLSYTENAAIMTLRPGLFGSTIGNGSSATALAFANALDGARATSYTSLSNVYGLFDVMDVNRLAGAFDNLAPRIANEAARLGEDQGAEATQLVADRLSLLGTKSAGRGRFTIVGAPQALAPGLQLSESSAAQLSFANSFARTEGSLGSLPESMSGFISGGRDYAPSLGVTGGERSNWHMAMGLEMEVAPAATLGTAFAHVDGRSGAFTSLADASTSQAAVYGSVRLGGGAYVGGLASIAHTRLGLKRSDGLQASLANLRADTDAMSLTAQAEAGVNLDVARGLTLTPRAALRYARTDVSGYSESGAETALAIDSIGLERVEARLGATLSGKMGKVKGWTFAPEMRADYVMGLSKGANSIDVAFAAAPEYRFALPFASGDRSWAEVKAGFKLANGPLAFGAGLETSVGRSDWRDDRAVANVSFAF